jgi:hypothetical protein
MFAAKPRGPRIVYVAASAHELPEEVQRWLGRAENRAAGSPHIYDALALLAGGARPAALIVSLEAVDWNEMDFFDQAARISRETHIYVTGHRHDAAKLEAACKRGASLFDEETIREDLAGQSSWKGVGVSDILAARLASASPPAPPRPTVIRPVPPEPPETDTPDLPEESPETQPEPEPAPVEPPPVRLLDPAEVEAIEETAEKDPGQSIPFPWSPSPNRPKRTPPKARRAKAEPAAPAPASKMPPMPPPPAPIPRQPVELTAEELSALMGRPITPDKPAKEGTA